jgi:hypothetical protein
MTLDRPRSGLPAGYDDASPYDGEYLSTYPQWWRANVELFEAHGMRPYRPARFADGAVVRTVLERLESDLGVNLSLQASDPGPSAAWAVLVDGDTVAHVDRERTTEAVTRYLVNASTFERLVRDAAG